MPNLLIGCDVGGTNTDAVLLDTSQFNAENRGVIAFHKTSTTADVGDAISIALGALFNSTVNSHSFVKEDVLAVSIGTTHFINAVIEQDTARLDEVAVLRLSGPYGRRASPFSDFPPPLAKVLHGYATTVDGGYHVDGQEIQPLDTAAITEFAKEAKSRGLRAVAITGTFSSLNKDHEAKAASIVKSILGDDAQIVISSDVSGVGFLARENATILNASIMRFAQKIIASFSNSVRRLGLGCPIFLTQNDGTVLTLSEAAKTPIRTFSSGATNSMRGAAFLCSRDPEFYGKSCAVVDVGGTTTDVGMLLPSGFPRQASAHCVVGGVRMNFSMPHVESIGLGGGSIVTEADGHVHIGPESVGSEITTRALAYGGSTVTATDVTLAAGTRTETSFSLGTKPVSSFSTQFSPEFIASFSKALVDKMSKVIDGIRTSPDPVPVILVGGGSFISPLALEGASIVTRPPYYQIANAIGAAIAKLSVSVSTIQVLDPSMSKEAYIERVIAGAKQSVVDKGARADSISIVDLVTEPVPYVDGTYVFQVKVVGDPDFEKLHDLYEKRDNAPSETPVASASIQKSSTNAKDIDEAFVDHETYAPTINAEREWIINETDLEYLRIGTYILGCGGGGSPYAIYLEVRNLLRSGVELKVINPFDALKKCRGEGTFLFVGHGGSPTVSSEQLAAEELQDSCEAMLEYFKADADGIFPLEIGGGNGLCAFLCYKTGGKSVPIVDTDQMGRAFPMLSQLLSVVLTKKRVFLEPTSTSDGNGNKVVINGAQTDLHVEKILRAALTQVGCSMGCCGPPMSSQDVADMTVHHSISTAWRIGRAVHIGRQKHDIDRLPSYILDSLGGEGTVGKQLFHGKVVGVERKLHMGHIYGELVIQGKDNDLLRIPFKNENIAAEHKPAHSDTWTTIATVPDLISVSHADSGEACGTPEYRYGIIVFVIAFSPHPLWVSTEKGLETGGPKAFGPRFENVQYKPVGEFKQPRSVIDEYASC